MPLPEPVLNKTKSFLLPEFLRQLFCSLFYFFQIVTRYHYNSVVAGFICPCISDPNCSIHYSLLFCSRCNCCINTLPGSILVLVFSPGNNMYGYIGFIKKVFLSAFNSFKQVLYGPLFGLHGIFMWRHPVTGIRPRFFCQPPTGNIAMQVH